MGNNLIDSRFVELKLGFGKSEVRLEDYLRTAESIPIEMFGDTSASLNSAIASAIAHLKDAKGGEVYIPPTTDPASNFNTPAVIIRSTPDRQNRPVVNYITSNYRYPINSESRPYEGGDWLKGDIVINTDYDTNKCMGWVCTDSGSPGIWTAFAWIKPWYTQIEVVTELPEPSPPQEGRQLILRQDESQAGSLYYCTATTTTSGSTTYSWSLQGDTASYEQFISEVQTRIDALEETFKSLGDEFPGFLIMESYIDPSARMANVLYANVEKRDGSATPFTYRVVLEDSSGNLVIPQESNSVATYYSLCTYDEPTNSYILGMTNPITFDNILTVKFRAPSNCPDNPTINLLGENYQALSTLGANLEEGAFAEGVLLTMDFDRLNHQCYLISSGGSGSGSIAVQINPPAGKEGMLWINPSTRTPSFWYNSQWNSLVGVWG